MLLNVKSGMTVMFISILMQGFDMKVTNRLLINAAAIAFITIVPLISVQAIAADACNNAYTQVDLNECTAVNLRNEDQQLNRSYNTLRRFLDAGEKEQLKQVQLAWINFRDKSCKFSARNLEGGSAYRMEHNGCLTNYTKQRRLEFDLEIASVQ